MMKLSSIIGVVVRSLKSEFKCQIYSEDVKRNYKTPCFFIKVLVTTSQETKNVSQKRLDIILTYFPDPREKDDLQYMRLLDRVCELFLTGIGVENRHLKLTDISSGRAGEEDDIFQIYLTTEFLDAIEFSGSGNSSDGDDGEGREIMGDLSMVLSIEEE